MYKQTKTFILKTYSYLQVDNKILQNMALATAKKEKNMRKNI